MNLIIKLRCISGITLIILFVSFLFSTVEQVSLDGYIQGENISDNNVNNIKYSSEIFIS